MLRFLTAGESHGPCLLGIIEGLPAGLSLTAELINQDLRRRQGGYGRSARQSMERDQVEFLSGLTQGRTTGAPLALRIANGDWQNQRDQEQPPLTIPRPGHADLAGALKYGHADLRLVAERASARETAMRVAVGAVAKALLSTRGIAVWSYVTEIGSIIASLPALPPADLHALAEQSPVRCPDPVAASQMRPQIDAARQAGDSLGGVFVVVATGVPAGLGSYVHWDRRLDGLLAQAVMSIPAIKGVEIGDGFSAARRRGTEAQDAILLQAPCSTSAAPFCRPTNHAGGIEGGVSNGQDIIVRAAMKPIPTTLTPQRSVDLATMTPATTRYIRSDICAVPAASIVGEAMVAWVLAVALLGDGPTGS
jgi:chorismate synthase